MTEKEVRHPQRRQFRDAQSARVEHFQHRAVAASLGRRAVDGADDAVDLRGRQYVGQVASEFRCVDVLRRRGLDLLFQQQEVVEAPYAAQLAGLRGLFASSFVEQPQVALDHFAFHLVGRHVPLAQDEVGELAQIAHVRLHGVVRESFFQFDVGAVAASRVFPFFRVFGHRCTVFPGFARCVVAGEVTKFYIMFHAGRFRVVPQAVFRVPQAQVMPLLRKLQSASCP